jgi:hypothetical protein
MSLHLTTALVDGSRRVVTRTGAVLLVLLLGLQALLVTSVNTVIIAEAPSATADVIGLTLPVSGTAAGAILAATVVLNAAYFVVLSRALAPPLPQLASVPAELYTRRIGRASLTMLGSGLITAVAVMVGFALLFFPVSSSRPACFSSSSPSASRIVASSVPSDGAGASPRAIDCAWQ